MWSEINDWLERARRLIPAQDREILLCPPRLVARFSRFALHRTAGVAGSAVADEVAARDPELVSLLCDLWRVLARYYFRFRVEGLDHVPARGPVLLVGNHCGGFVPSEGFFTALALHDHFGPQRAVYALAHDFLFEDALLRQYAARMGLLRAGHGSARHAFSAGACVLVYPGSDLDTFRPFRDRHQVVLGGRKGFIKLALRERVPIIPVVAAGTHEQLIVLSRGDRLARLLHARVWSRADVVPIVLSMPWGLTSGFVPYLPLPAQTTLSFLPPMTWPELGPESVERSEDLDRCYRDVETAMQRELDRLSARRRFLRGQRYPTAQPLREIEPHAWHREGVNLAAPIAIPRGAP
ncbi:MAG TPA: lysophospholipid acyltransferase family protein [Kofleriaceae bacterium]|nr:lysophospholipid acyltransferase family protein [Kofleriaceae bacterium]